MGVRVRLDLRISPELKARLAAIAHEQGTSQNALGNEAIERWVAQWGRRITEQQQQQELREPREPQGGG